MENNGFSVQPIESADLWNAFMVEHTDDTFHQAWEWGETYEVLGSNVWHLGLYQHQELVGVALTIKIAARRGSFLLVPHGPLLTANLLENETALTQAMDAFLKELRRVATQERCVFIRVAPTFNRTEENAGVFRKLGFRKAPIFVQSELSWRLKLDKTEEELLADMRKSTRYILRRADSYGVTLDSSADPADFDRFYSLYNKTVKQQEFVGQNKTFVEREFLSFLKNNGARLYFAQRGGKDLATAMIILQGKSGFYHYGASQKDEENTPAPHLLQWHIIKDLKNRGYGFYNFWGISPEDKPDHPWRGLTIFKKGFGGEELVYLQTQDYILKWSYWLNWIVETVRRIKRRY